jgi:hypothetical protein
VADKFISTAKNVGYKLILLIVIVELLFFIQQTNFFTWLKVMGINISMIRQIPFIVASIIR